MKDLEQKRKQVAQQCLVVSTLAERLMSIHADYEELISSGTVDDIIDIVGDRTAYLMEELGNTLDAMDAHVAKDEWMNPVFETAHKMYPVNKNPSDIKGDE